MTGLRPSNPGMRWWKLEIRLYIVFFLTSLSAPRSVIGDLNIHAAKGMRRKVTLQQQQLKDSYIFENRNFRRILR